MPSPEEQHDGCTDALRPRSESLARQHHARPARSGHAQGLHRRALRHGAHVEPHDLRARDPEQRGLRRRDPEPAERGPVGRGALLRPRPRGPDARGRPVPAGARSDGRRRRMGLAGGLPAAGARHRGHDRGGPTPARAGGTAEPVHQDPRDAGGPPRDRGGHLRGRAGQRDAALLPRAVPGRCRGVPPRHRAPHRRGAPARRRVGRVAVRQPVGRVRRGPGAGSAPQPARHRDRPAHLPGLPGGAWLSALAADLQPGRPSPASALGEHRHEGSRGADAALRAVARRAVHREHDARRRR